MDRQEAKELAVDGNIQASAVLTVGPAIWKAVSNISNVDFLLGINGEKFNMLLNFLEGPGWALLTIVGVVWFFARISYRKYLPPKPGPNWALLVSSIVVAFLFGVLVTVSSTGGVPALFVAWGSGDIHTCSAVVDANKLISFRKDYKLAVVCGYQDASKDRLDDENITVSNRFTITPGAIQVVTAVALPMAQRAAQIIADGQKGNQNASVAIPTWYDVILLPNEIPTSKVAKLADVTALGGKILNSQYFN
jgi:hypothetical protein